MQKRKYKEFTIKEDIDRFQPLSFFDTVLMPIPRFNKAYRLEPSYKNCYPKKLDLEKQEKLEKKVNKVKQLFQTDELIDKSFDSKIKAIIGKDTRKRVTKSDFKKSPYSSVGVIYARFSNKWYQGTGSYIGNNKILTAAHVIFDTETNQIADRIIFIPLKDENSEPIGRFEARKVLVAEKYVNAPKFRFMDDWAVILSDSLVGKLCPLPVAGSHNHRAVTSGKNWMEIPGYPGEKNGRIMYTGINTYLSMNYSRIATWVDTTAGQSGSPILVENLEMSYNQIVGVLSGHRIGPNGPINYTSRLNDNDILKIWTFS